MRSSAAINACRESTGLRPQPVRLVRSEEQDAIEQPPLKQWGTS